MGWLIVVGGVVFALLAGAFLIMQVAQQIVQAIP